MPTLLLVSAACCITSFYWAARRFFTIPSGMAPTMKLINVVTVISSPLHMAAVSLWNRAPVAAQGIGLTLYGLSFGLFWWTIATHRTRRLSLAFSEDAPSHLVRKGPYAWVRHPFYLSYLLTWLAGPVASGRVILIVTPIVLGALYYRAAIMEESKFHKSSLAADYRAYCDRTGRFLPRLWRGRGRPTP